MRRALKSACVIELGDALKRNSLYTGRFALTGVAAAALWFTVPDASALGLGRIAVQSALGETLRAEIDVTSLTPEEASNLRVRVAPPESYRSAGVDYNPVLPGTLASLEKRADGRLFLKLSSDKVVQEPFVDVILELSWNTGRLVREYTLLFDPPSERLAAPAQAAQPIATDAVTAPPPTATAPAPKARPKAVATETVPKSATTAATTAATAPAAPGADEYVVRNGDTLSRIASRTRRPGVSLDQMLVSLYRSNPHAFVEDNMNRLKSGVVLAVPSAEVVKALSAGEAKDVIQAQSADFGAYRRKLAGAVPEAKVEGPKRQAGGKVQATVEDRKQAAAPTPDKLTLSKGSSDAKASAPEDRLSKEREKKDAAARMAELSKNVEQLKRLSGAASAVAQAPVAPPAPAPVAAPAPAPAPVAAPVPAPIAAPVAPSALPDKPGLAVTAPAMVPPPAASAPLVDAAPLTSEPASAAASAPAPVVTAPRPAVRRPVAPPVQEPSMIESLIDENPLVVAIGAALAALLVGFGIYRFVSRSRRDNGETSFLESRLQPDSFFGASGGQRIDTRDASGASSSMSYSLSQLDAIGDVDPVAEADVYLAYGRDLQAEEILKEAMRSNPERLAIRTKLLEVYAKRRDTKGFEQLATQLFALTHGAGEDWAKAQELGVQIDPENPLYIPGGAPPMASAGGGRMSEPLSATTMPQSILPSPSQFERSAAESARVDSSAVDLELDVDTSAPASRSPAMPSLAPAPEVRKTNFDAIPELPKAEPAASAPGFPMDFDLSGINLDIDAPQNPSAPSGALEQDSVGGIDFAADEDDGADPLARKLELAEEFRQIGDLEGARDLLQEVVSKGTGALKSRAQGMLDRLA